MKALILDGKVVDVHPEGFEVHPSMKWIDCSEDCQVGDTFDELTNVIIPSRKPSAADKLDQLRMVRNKKLRTTDHWCLSDRTPTTEQLNYRQELRDITSKYKNLEQVIWPTYPE